MKLRNILTMSVIVSTSLFAEIYEGCGVSKNSALDELSKTIVSNIDSTYKSDIKVSSQGGEDNVQKDIASYFNATSNITLQNIKYKKKKNLICAYVDSKEQVKYTKKLLKKVKTFDVEFLPDDLDSRLKQLKEWLNDIKHVKQLSVVFLNQETINKDFLELQKKEKQFQDMYDKAILKSKSLVFKGCDKDKDDALEKLNSVIFNKKKNDSGFFSKVTSIFGSETKEEKTQKMAVELFNSKIKYKKEGEKTCAVIEKSEISNVAKRIYHDLMMFNEKLLSTDQKERYKEIEKLLDKVETAKLLMKPFPNIFTKIEFNKLSNLKAKLEGLKAKTNPQDVKFTVLNGKNYTILVDNKKVDMNKKIYLKEGPHSYEITSKNFCPIKGTFELDKFEEEVITVDVSDYKFPTVLFITDKTPTIAVDGIMVKPNVTTPIKKCSGEVIYIAKYSNQTNKGKITLEPNGKFTQDLEFLTSAEINEFNNVKTRYFKTKTGEKFSESLTSVASDKLKFKVKSSPSHGDLDLDERGTFVYTADKDFVGKVSFEYYIKAEGKGESATKVVNIEIEPSKEYLMAQQKKAEEAKRKKELEEKKKQEELEKQKALAAKKKEEELKQKTKKELDKAEKTVKEEAKKASKAVSDFDEAKYKKFKVYIQTLNPVEDAEKIKKLAKKYPQYFNKFLEDMKK